jgi:hypothetical protein
MSSPRHWSVGRAAVLERAAAMIGGRFGGGGVRKIAARSWYLVPSNSSIRMRQGLHCSYVSICEG